MPHAKPKRPQNKTCWPHNRRTIRLFVAGLTTITLGYLCLAQSPVNGFLTQTLAPILLALGYLILNPLALLQNIRS